MPAGDVLAAGLVVRVKDGASRVLGVIGNGFKSLERRGRALAGGVGTIASAFGRLRVMGLALGVAMGGMANQAAAFEQQMSAVQSVLLAQKDDPAFKALGSEIKRLGATTAFSATEAAQGAEFLSRAGFTAQDQIKALGAVMDAAAADSIPLASAANLVANGVRQFGLETTQATMVADVMALTSAKTNTNMLQLAEGMRYVAPIARGLGVDVKQTSTALGLLANAGLQGSIGGTALKNMLLKLANPSDDIKKKFNALGIKIQDAKGNMLPLTQVIGNISGGLGKMSGNLKKTAFLQDAFGLRGQVAAQNLSVAFDQMQKKTKDGRTEFEVLVDSIENSEGAAKKMAKIRLDNLRGQFTLLRSAIEGVAIEFFGPVNEAFTGGLKVIVETVSIFAQALQNADDVLAGKFNPNMEGVDHISRSAAIGIGEFAAGVLDARDVLVEIVNKGNEWRLAAIEAFGGNSEGNRGLGKFLTLAAFATVAIGAIGVAVQFLIVPIAGFVTGLVSGAASILVALAPVLLVIGAVALVLNATRRESQTFGERVREVFSGLMDTGQRFFAGFMDGVNMFIVPAFETFKVVLYELGAAFQPVFDAFAEQFEGTSDSATNFGALVATVFAAIIDVLGVFVQVLTPIVLFFTENFAGPLIRGLGFIFNAFNDLVSGTETLGGALKRIFKGIMVTLMNTFFAPMKFAILGIIEAAEAVGAITAGKAAAVRAFLNADPGSMLGEDPREVQRRKDEAAASRAAKAALDANKTAKEAGMPNPETVVNVPKQPPAQVKGNLKTDLKVAGKNLSIATAEHEFELSQRGGAKLNPFQQGQIFAHGSLTP